MDKTGWPGKRICLALIFLLFFSSGLFTACSSGGDADKPQIDADAPAETDSAGEVDSVIEKTWDKMTWDAGKWG